MIGDSALFCFYNFQRLYQIALTNLNNIHAAGKSLPKLVRLVSRPPGKVNGPAVHINHSDLNRLIAVAA